jgi:soluble lytic murein transglycosylase
MSYPVDAAGANGWRWRLAFPRAFEDLVVDAAGKNALPPALLWAIAREESAFDPRVESFANAIGLAQLILPTARRFGDGLDITRETLRDPRTNLTVSGRFLGFLSQHWNGHPALMVPSYNAGEAATRRWVNRWARLPIDELVESIPYDETRRYTQRVLSTYGTYHFLYASAARPLDRFVSWRMTSR